MKYLKVFTDFAQSMEALGDAERGRLFTAMLEYAESGKLPDLRGNERFLWGTAKAQIDRAQERYDKDVANGKKGGRPKNPNKPIETQANPAEPNETQRNPNKPIETREDKDKEEDKDKDEDRGVGVSARARATTPPPPMPYGLTDQEITAALDRDQAIEQAARDCGLPIAPANMITARDLAAEHGLDTLLQAIRRAADGKSQTWGYVKGILRRWREQGYVDDGVQRQTGKRTAATAYTQRTYTDAELNAPTLALLREAEGMVG